jgi:hypothetical protein
MNPEVKAEAARYATEELDRKVMVAAVLDHGEEALALCHAQDDGDSFSLLLRYGRPGFFETGAQAWFVIEESNVEDFELNALRDGESFAVSVARNLLEGIR